jgi:hypothetical protein
MSLVEVLLAAVIMAVAMTTIFQALDTGLKGTERIEGETLGTALAQDLLDFLSTVPFRHLAAVAPGGKPLLVPDLSRLAEAFATIGPGAATTVAAVRRKVAAIVTPIGYSASVGVEVPEGGPTIPSNLRIVTIWVRWTAALAPGKKVSRKIVLSALVSDEQDLSL